MPRLPEPEPLDQDLVDLLHERSGTETIVELDGGLMCRVLNIAWGYDAGDSYAHITTNISLPIPGYEIDFFFTKEIIAALDAVVAVELWRANSETLPEDSACTAPGGAMQEFRILLTARRTSMTSEPILPISPCCFTALSSCRGD